MRSLCLGMEALRSVFSDTGIIIPLLKIHHCEAKKRPLNLVKSYAGVQENEVKTGGSQANSSTRKL